MDPNRRTRLISTLGIVAVIVVLAVVVVRFIGGEMVALDLPADPSGFTGISSVGGWKITVRRGEYDVAVRVGERSADDVRVEVRDGTLLLGVAPGMRAVTDTLEATVSLPRLDRLQIDGGAEVRLDEVVSDSLAVDVDGAASITATGGRYGRLEVEVDGAANVDFADTAVFDADIDLDGASNLSITMAGGTLTGYLRGVGNVSYGGEVADESVRVEGLGTVRAR